ncbi:DUF3576 domain-containing protein [Pelagibacteraceae bacterium]|jgi:hypothetical protein|nr:DUF3576 domain-containing protein [Pelagibacteraceae bacterium]|tara:strand:- start:7093 stop:7611 length:519 start_codon:yes stop_codon:yes gene_type:complete
MKKTICLLIISSFLLISCGGGKKIFRPVDLRKEPVSGKDKARKNVEEGRGISIMNSMKKRRGTNYEFSTSNPMWRASLEILDVLPLTTVDYSGGIIITDWYSDANSSNESIKITLRFLSNEVRSDSLKVVVHKKNCNVNNNCTVNKIDSKIQEELIMSVIKKAAMYEKDKKK